MRLAVYTDYVYRRDAEGVSGERAFVRFMLALRPHVDSLTLVGREHPEPGRSHYAVPDDVELVGLPYYASLASPGGALRTLLTGLRRFWRLLDDVDCVWLLGPYLQAIAFAGVAVVRRRRVVLGVRQDLPTYVRSRHPGRRWAHVAADVLEGTFRRMARRRPVAVVGPDLARRYAGSRAVLELTVSLVEEADVVDVGAALARPANDPPHVLSVGRLDREKNPLLLADVLAGLHAAGVPCRLLVVGEGSEEAALRARLAELGVADHADLLGYVPIDGGLTDLYRSSDVFLHVSHTEGLPQVVFESFAAGLPLVATDVGGVAQAVGDAGLLIPPRDASAAVDAVVRVLRDPEERRRLVTAGHAAVSSRTMEQEARRLAAFLRDA